MSQASETPEKELARLRQWVNDLQSAQYINCVYCGFRYGPVTTTPATAAAEIPPTMREILHKHVESCPKHPMSRLKADNAVMLKALREIANPIKAMQEGVPPGYIFEGHVAVAMANDPNYYRAIAKKALGETGSEE